MWHADNQQYAVAFVVFSSVGGSILGPVIGGFVQQYLAWQWNIWIQVSFFVSLVFCGGLVVTFGLQLIFGVAVQVAHFFLVPETRSTIMMNNIAKRRRKTGEDPTIYGPTEGKKFADMFSAKELAETWVRPFRMFLTEPIVLTLSLLSGFSDALVFMFIQSFSLVYKQWDFNDYEVGLAFIAILVGYVIGMSSINPIKQA